MLAVVAALAAGLLATSSVAVETGASARLEAVGPVSGAATASARATRVNPPAAPTSTLPPGSPLPSGDQCRARVQPAAEVRAVNTSYNNTVGTRPNTVYPRVDGNFRGTTDEIIQWAACKWGIDVDVVRAQIAKESYWHQDASGGDNGESFGLGQVRNTAHQSAFVDNNAIRSSAYNLDYTYAVWRTCFDGGFSWLNNVERGATYAAGDMWGCLGVWFSGRWYTDPAKTYIAEVKDLLAKRIWQTPSFISG
jgi:hypothetical protein